MKNIKLKLAPPWVTFVNELVALFGDDPDIRVEYDNANVAVKIYVDNPDKEAVLRQLLPLSRDYGNVMLDVMIIPANPDAPLPIFDFVNKSMKELYEVAFDGNPVFAFAKEIRGLFNNVVTFVVFKNRVVQFFNDNLNDIYGNVSTLYEDIAADVFDRDDVQPVFYCTDIEGKVDGAPKVWL